MGEVARRRRLPRFPTRGAERQRLPCLQHVLCRDFPSWKISFHLHRKTDEGFISFYDSSGEKKRKSIGSGLKRLIFEKHLSKLVFVGSCKDRQYDSFERILEFQMAPDGRIERPEKVNLV